MAQRLHEDAENLARVVELLLANVPNLPPQSPPDTNWVDTGDEAPDPRSPY